MSAKLNVLLLNGDSPVIGPNAAEELRSYIAAVEGAGQPRRPSEDEVERMITRLALATKDRSTSKEEASERLDVYWRALRDVPIADLRLAFDVLIKTSKWMPMPAEIHTEAARYKTRRDYLLSRARHLVWKHEREWRPAPADRVTPADIARIKAEIAAMHPPSGLRGRSDVASPAGDA